MKIVALAVACVVALWIPVVAGTSEAPLDTRGGGAATFAAAPKAQAAGDKVKITFAVSASTDVEVAIVDAKGQVVRHLAAGLLGKNAPEPLQKDSLAQELLWDRKDDAGQTAANGPFSVRVGIGAKPGLKQYAGWDSNTVGNIVALAVGKNSEVFVLSSETFRGGTNMRVLDKNGTYLRTIMPYAAGTPKERAGSVGQLDIEGERLPIVYNALGRTTYPLTSGMRQQNMAMHPKGYLLMASAIGTMAEQGPSRHVLALDPQGGAPEGMDFVGPLLRPPHGGIGGAGEGTIGLFDHLALSPDGQWIYLAVSPLSRVDRNKQHGVLRFKWSDKDAGALWLGKEASGTGDDEFNDPEGLAVDAQGNLYVCDWGNNRVMIFSPDGKPLGKFPVDKPQQIAVHPASGQIYVLSCSPISRWGRIWNDDTVLRKFPAWGKGENKELAKLDHKGMNVMALDGASTPAKVWVGGLVGLCAVADKGETLEIGARIDNKNGLDCPWFIAGDPVRNRVFLYEHGSTNTPEVLAMDLATGKRTAFAKGTDMTLDRDGNVYVMGGRDSAFYRFDPSGKPLPFSGINSNKVMTKGYRGYGPNLGIPGIAVGAEGDVYVMRSSNGGNADAYGARVDVFGADGKPKKESIIDGMGCGDCGVGVDVAGNIYVGANVKPADKPYPTAFMGKLPAKGWTYWNKEREIPWCYPYLNEYLFHWGSVFKFSSAGGAFYGQAPWNLKDPKYGQPKPADILANAPADATSYRSSYLSFEVKESGAVWRYAGFGIIPSSSDGLMPDPGCVCHQGHIAVDAYGRVFVPDVFRFSVEMLDTNGNQIARIGRYGNVDSAGPGSKVPDPEIGLVWPAFVSVGGGELFISDAVNQRVVVVKFDYAAQETRAIP